jgi:maltoporin
MKLKSALSALTLALASTYAVADPPDFHGYFRAGAGQNSKGGEMVCFKTPGAQNKYRLGNECDNYGEFLFSADVFKGKDGALWRGHQLTTTNSGFPPIGDNGITRFNQMWRQPRHYPVLKGATLWAGRFLRSQSDANAILIMGDGTVRASAARRRLW